MIETIARPWRGGGVPLNPRTALQELIAKVFSAPFAKTFSAPLGGAAAAAIPWFLSGGIAAANCIDAWDAKNAASYVASKVGLLNSTTLSDGAYYPTWSAGVGWSHDVAIHQVLTSSIVPTNDQTYTMVINYTGVSGTGGFLAGIQTGSIYFGIQPNRAGNTCGYWSGGYLVVAPAKTSGVSSVCGNLGYRDGTADAGTISTGAGSWSGGIFIGGVAQYDNNITATIKQIAIYKNSPLTAPQNSALSTAMAAL